MQTEAPRLDGGSWALLVTLASLWSISFIFIKVAGAEFPILTLVLVRVALAALVLHGVVLASGRRYPGGGRLLLRYASMGLFNNVLPGILIVYATIRIGAGAASILNATVPLFTLVIAHASTADEKITPVKLVGILVGMAGVAAIIGPPALGGVTANLVATLAMLAATFCYGLSNRIGRSFGGIDPVVSAACQLTAATLVLLPLALILDRPWTLPPPSGAAVFSAVGLALLSTALAYVLFFRLIARAGATNTSLVTLLIPVNGVMLAWVILGEVLTLGEAAGMVLIGLGLTAINRGTLRLSAARPALTPEPLRPGWRR
jgi:drug/metabolite transporter (DMT)-like permease